MSDESLYCTFRIAGQLYGVPVAQVQEVLLGQHLTRVPLAPPAACGLINLRGQIVTAIDMRRVLGLPSAADPGEQMNIVLRGDGAATSLLVDAISDVISPAAPLEPTPETLRHQLGGFVAGVFQLERALLLVLDVARVLDDAACTQSPVTHATATQSAVAH